MDEKIKFRIIQKQNKNQYNGKPFYVVKYKALLCWKYITSYTDTLGGSGLEPKTFGSIDDAKKSIEEKADELKLDNNYESGKVIEEIEV